MSEVKKYPAPASISSTAWIDEQKYREMYQQSVDDPDTFWAEQAEEFVSWFKPWDKVQSWEYNKAEKSANIKWFGGAKLNVS